MKNGSQQTTNEPVITPRVLAAFRSRVCSRFFFARRSIDSRCDDVISAGDVAVVVGGEGEWKLADVVVSVPFISAAGESTKSGDIDIVCVGSGRFGVVGVGGSVAAIAAMSDCDGS